MDGVVKRVAAQLEYPVVDARAYWTKQRDLRAAPRVETDVGLADVQERFPVGAASGREIRLHAEERKRRLQQHVAHPRAQAGGEVLFLLGRARVLEFEANDEQ